MLQRPRTKGCLNLLDTQAQNEAIEPTWLKSYLDFSTMHPLWAIVTDIIIDAATPPNMCHVAQMNSFLQNWEPPTRGQCANRMNNDIIRMLKATKRNNTNLAAIHLSPHLQAQLPTWYHMASAPCPVVNATSKCMLRTHGVRKVMNLISTSARLQNPTIDLTSPHQKITFCYCPDYSRDWLRCCQSPYACAQKAQVQVSQMLIAVLDVSGEAGTWCNLNPCHPLHWQNAADTFPEQVSISSVPYYWKYTKGHLPEAVVACTNPGWIYSHHSPQTCQESGCPTLHTGKHVSQLHVCHCGPTHILQQNWSFHDEWQQCLVLMSPNPHALHWQQLPRASTCDLYINSTHYNNHNQTL